MSPSSDSDSGNRSGTQISADTDTGTEIGADTDFGRSVLTYGLLVALLLASGLYYAFVI